jgi:tetratricopeptide (TPR) repeat protein
MAAEKEEFIPSDAPTPAVLAQQDLQLAQRAFESGQYRTSIEALERALALAPPGMLLHGEVTIWLVTAYEAAGDRESARLLCTAATKHPQWDIRKEAKRLLYILKAPVLRSREDWQAKIPDLENLEPKTDGQKWAAPKSPAIRPPRPAPAPKGYQIAPLPDPNVAREDRAFVWVVLGAIAVLLVGLTWFGVTDR